VNQFDLRDNYARFLFALGYPFDVRVEGARRPPVPVLDVLIGLYIDEANQMSSREVKADWRESFAIELGEDPWAQ
jgi:hypothetical protein